MEKYMRGTSETKYLQLKKVRTCGGGANERVVQHVHAAVSSTEWMNRDYIRERDVDWEWMDWMEWMYWIERVEQIVQFVQGGPAAAPVQRMRPNAVARGGVGEHVWRLRSSLWRSIRLLLGVLRAAQTEHIDQKRWHQAHQIIIAQYRKLCCPY